MVCVRARVCGGTASLSHKLKSVARLYHTSNDKRQTTNPRAMPRIARIHAQMRRGTHPPHTCTALLLGCRCRCSHASCALRRRSPAPDREAETGSHRSGATAPADRIASKPLDGKSSDPAADRTARAGRARRAYDPAGRTRGRTGPCRTAPDNRVASRWTSQLDFGRAESAASDSDSAARRTCWTPPDGSNGAVRRRRMTRKAPRDPHFPSHTGLVSSHSASCTWGSRHSPS